MKIDAPRIKSWVERIEVLLTQRKDINEDIRDIFTEIKKGDHDAKAIRKLIQRRGEDPSELAKQDDLLAAYTDAIAGKIKALEAIERGASTKEAAKAGGISTGAVSNLSRVHKSRFVNEPHDPQTGEIEERSDRQSAPCTSNPASASSSPPTPAELDAEAERLGLTGVVLELARRAEIDITIPDFLRRERTAA